MRSTLQTPMLLSGYKFVIFCIALYSSVTAVCRRGTIGTARVGRGAARRPRLAPRRGAAVGAGTLRASQVYSWPCRRHCHKPADGSRTTILSQPISYFLHPAPGQSRGCAVFDSLRQLGGRGGAGPEARDSAPCASAKPWARPARDGRCQSRSRRGAAPEVADAGADPADGVCGAGGGATARARAAGPRMGSRGIVCPAASGGEAVAAATSSAGRARPLGAAGHV
jgi:hypothetical protein